MISVRGHRCGDGFRIALVQHVEHLISLVDGIASRSLGQRKHGEALRAVAEFASTRSLEDHRLVALWTVSSQFGGGSMEYKPGKEQTGLLSQVGFSVDGSPDPNDTLNELALAALQDYVGFAGGRLAALTRDLAAAEKGAARVPELEERAGIAEQQREAALARVRELEAALKHTSEERDVLAAGLPGEPKEKPRREPAKAGVGGKEAAQNGR